MEKIIQQLNDLAIAGATRSQLETIIKAKNAPVERRVAAILSYVPSLESPIGTVVLELMMSLTEPDWTTSAVDPTKTPIGAAVVRHLDDSPARLAKLNKDEDAGITEGTAAQLIRYALASEYPSNDSLDFVLKCNTGHDALWWIDWINEHRGKKKRKGQRRGPRRR